MKTLKNFLPIIIIVTLAFGITYLYTAPYDSTVGYWKDYVDYHYSIRLP